MGGEQDRLSKIELAIERLTTINEIQTDQMKILLKNGGVMVSLTKSVEEHSENIVELYRRDNDQDRRLEEYRLELNNLVTDARTSMTKASYARLFLAVSVSATVTLTLFGINRAYIDKLDSTRTMMISRMGVVEEKLSHCYGNGKWDDKTVKVEEK